MTPEPDRLPPCGADPWYSNVMGFAPHPEPISLNDDYGVLEHRCNLYASVIASLLPGGKRFVLTQDEHRAWSCGNGPNISCSADANGDMFFVAASQPLGEWLEQAAEKARTRIAPEPQS